MLDCDPAVNVQGGPLLVHPPLTMGSGGLSAAVKASDVVRPEQAAPTPPAAVTTRWARTFCLPERSDFATTKSWKDCTEPRPPASDAMTALLASSSSHR